MSIKKFRGKLASGAQTTIRLGTNNGLTGYRINKLQIIHVEPGEDSGEHTVKVFNQPQDPVDNTIDFSNNALLGAAYLVEEADKAYPVSTVIVFDSEVFNQDIYVTHKDTEPGGNKPCNYYLELDQVKLNLDEAAVATLKDMRGRE